MGHYEQFLNTTCITHLSFLGSIEEGNPDLLQPEVSVALTLYVTITMMLTLFQVSRYLAKQLGRPVSSVFTLLGDPLRAHPSTASSSSSMITGIKRRYSMKGTLRRSRSRQDGKKTIHIDIFRRHFLTFIFNHLRKRIKQYGFR